MIVLTKKTLPTILDYCGEKFEFNIKASLKWKFENKAPTDKYLLIEVNNALKNEYIFTKIKTQ